LFNYRDKYTEMHGQQNVKSNKLCRISVFMQNVRISKVGYILTASQEVKNSNIKYLKNQIFAPYTAILL